MTLNSYRRSKGESTYTIEWWKSNVQIGPDITSGSLDKCRRRRLVGACDNLIPDIVSQNVVITGECINGIDV